MRIKKDGSGTHLDITFSRAAGKGPEIERLLFVNAQVRKVLFFQASYFFPSVFLSETFVRMKKIYLAPATSAFCSKKAAESSVLSFSS